MLEMLEISKIVAKKDDCQVEQESKNRGTEYDQFNFTNILFIKK
jgi:hypothetical protein